MKLKFINKNNRKEYEVIEGAQLSMSYNEDLSSGTLMIVSKEVIDIEPYDEVLIDDTYYMCIDTFNEREVRNRTNDKVYEYEIQVMSQTKLLENKILPSLSITPLKSETKRSIKFYLERYNNLYGEKIRTESGFVNRFEFDVGNKFDDACPELQFNKPTFRECITKLMMVKNCIPVLRNNKIGYIDLSKNTNTNWLWNNMSQALYRERSQSSADYVSELKMDMKNVIQDNNLTIATEYIGFRSNDCISLSDKNLDLYTQYPIYDLVSIEMIFLSYYQFEHEDPEHYIIRNNLMDIDGKSWIHEKSKYDTLDVAKTMDSIPHSDYHKYQNSCLYWTRGDNHISGFNNTSKTSWLGFTANTFILITDALFLRYIGLGKPIFNPFYYQVAFKITYKTKSALTVKCGKDKIQTTNKEVVDNQNENYVNAYTQGLLEYSKANRLGNVMATYHLKYNIGETLPVIGDTIDIRNIIYKAEYGFSKRSIDVTLLACPDYVLRNYFTGVQSKLRSWKIVDSSEAFEREELFKTYIEFDYKERNERFYTREIPSGDNFNNLVKNLLGSYATDVKDLKHIAIGPQVNDSASCFCYFADVAKNEVGHSVVYSCGYEDNESVGRYITDTEIEGGKKQGVYSYTDGNGECETFHFKFLYNFNPLPDLPSSSQHLTSSEYRSYLLQLTDYQKIQPKYTKDIVDDSYYLNYYKDNKEIMRFNFQYEFCSASDTIIITDNFMKMVKGEISHGSLEAVESLIPPDYFNPKVPGEMVRDKIALPTLTVNSTNKNFSLVSSAGSLFWTYVYQKKGEDEILLFCYQGSTIYGNFLKDRRKDIYEKNTAGEWVKKSSI